LIRDKIAT